MTTLALPTPSRSLLAAALLDLRRRRGLVVITSLLTVGATTATYGIMELLHLANAAAHGPAGGIVNLGHGAFVASAFGAIAATIVAAIAGTGDLEAGVYRDLVVTGRSRLRLYASRGAGGLVLVLPFVIAAYVLTAVATVAFAGPTPAPGVQLLATTGAWVLLQAVVYYLVGFGVACLLGSRSYAIGVGLAWRLAVTPLVMSISSLGVARELLPGTGLQRLAPAALGDTVRQGRIVPMSTAAAVAVLVTWTLVALAAGARRDVTREA